MAHVLKERSQTVKLPFRLILEKWFQLTKKFRFTDLREGILSN